MKGTPRVSDFGGVYATDCARSRNSRCFPVCHAHVDRRDSKAGTAECFVRGAEFGLCRGPKWMQKYWAGDTDPGILYGSVDQHTLGASEKARPSRRAQLSIGFEGTCDGALHRIPASCGCEQPRDHVGAPEGFARSRVRECDPGGGNAKARFIGGFHPEKPHGARNRVVRNFSSTCERRAMEWARH